MSFIDEVSITVASGSGGSGAVSFRREKHVPRGGPDGGDGGRGGDVVFSVDHNMRSLLNYRFTKFYSADSGGKGGGQHSQGADGKPLVLEVPPGTIVKDENQRILVDLSDQSKVILLGGGRGGKGNSFFKTSVNQAPRHAQPGEPGGSLKINLELKLIADVGLLGFPNAGKSTFLSVVSKAQPKIADYPFTTLKPQLGVVGWREKSFVLADIPGLIEKAAQGKGLGFQFLRHVERNQVLLHLIDVSEFAERPAWQAYEALNAELSEYDKRRQSTNVEHKKLSQRPQIIVLSKVDLATNLEELKKPFLEKGLLVFEVSSMTKLGISKLLDHIAKVLEL
ncbi:MAG: GTPase ObgE [Bdellovibrionaceae bacterium]|nr:GTPase ObgE [Pseudobdellovibrionaceae bacterium]